MRTATVTITLSLLLVTVLTSYVEAQADRVTTTVRNNQQLFPTAQEPVFSAPLTSNRQTTFGYAGRGSNNSALNKAIQLLQQADSDDDKDKAKEEIAAFLDKEYDRFIEQNQNQLEQMRARLKKLEEQLERRVDAKERLIELKLEMIVSQAEGLGWPGDGNFGNALNTAPAVQWNSSSNLNFGRAEDPFGNTPPRFRNEPASNSRLNSEAAVPGQSQNRGR